MTLLELVRQVMSELGLQTISGAVGNQEPSVRQILALMNRLGMDLTRDETDWQRLTREYILTTRAEQKTITTTVGSPVVTMADTSGLSARWGVTGEGARP